MKRLTEERLEEGSYIGMNNPTSSFFIPISLIIRKSIKNSFLLSILDPHLREKPGDKII
jgi:hypothetical protein